MTLLLCAVSINAWSGNDSDEITSIKQQGRNVVLTYSLSKHANRVDVEVIDVQKRKTYQVPEHLITGSLVDLESGQHTMTVNMRELGVVQSTDVRFQLVVDRTKSYNKHSIVLATIAPMPQFSYGLSYLKVRKWGWFINASTTIPPTIDNEGFARGRVLYTGTVKSTYWDANIGVVRRLSNPLSIYLGVGFSQQRVFWQTIDGLWYEHSEYEYEYFHGYETDEHGYNIESGLLLTAGKFALSVGCSLNDYAYYQAKLGIGLCF